jgi:hypothetical protein
MGEVLRFRVPLDRNRLPQRGPHESPFLFVVLRWLFRFLGWVGALCILSVSSVTLWFCSVWWVGSASICVICGQLRVGGWLCASAPLRSRVGGRQIRNSKSEMCGRVSGSSIQHRASGGRVGAVSLWYWGWWRVHRSARFGIHNVQRSTFKRFNVSPDGLSCALPAKG